MRKKFNLKNIKKQFIKIKMPKDEPWLCGAHQPGVHPRAVSGRTGHHPQRYRLLPGKAEPRPHQGPEPDAAGRYFLSLPVLQCGRGTGRQPL